MTNSLNKFSGGRGGTEFQQGWEIALGFLSESLIFAKNMSGLLISSYLVSNLSDSLTVAHSL